MPERGRRVVTNSPGKYNIALIKEIRLMRIRPAARAGLRNVTLRKKRGLPNCQPDLDLDPLVRIRLILRGRLKTSIKRLSEYSNDPRIDKLPRRVASRHRRNASRVRPVIEMLRTADTLTDRLSPIDIRVVRISRAHEATTRHDSGLMNIHGVRGANRAADDG